MEVHNVYFKPDFFHHFAYILSLARDCETRVEEFWKSTEDDMLPNDDVMICISYVGKMNDKIPIQKTLKNGIYIIHVYYSKLYLFYLNT